MKLAAADIYQLYQPVRCNLRARLNKLETSPQKADAFTELLRDLGKRYEADHLKTFPAHLDLSDGDFEQRSQDTIGAVNRGEDVIYQGVLFAGRESYGEEDSVVGIPDLLIKEGDSYVVRDCKLARHLGPHPEVLRQLELYGWLYEQTFGSPPARLEVLLGDGSLQDIPYDGGASALAVLDEIKQLATATEDPYEPVGWSKCGGCAFHDTCWPAAERRQDVALVPGVDQGLARHLHELGIDTYPQLLASYTAESLSETKRQQGSQLRRVGSAARKAMLHAKAMAEGRSIHMGRFPFTLDRDYVLFDLEGIPSQVDEVEKIYMWGMQVFGPKQGQYRPALATLGPEGDATGWRRFLEEAASVFREHGDIPFVHWAVYEKTMINKYVARYGDHDGIAQRVLDNLVDLLPITQETVVLPDSSYSLKVVELRAEYHRSMEEYGGSWSIARYIRAVEAGDEAVYNETMDDILQYNREDLEATWAVFTWLANNFGHEPNATT